MIELGFIIRGYPSGRRIEEETDLSQVYGADLINGAFMGDAILNFGEVDLSTDFGWVTLLDWCLRLSVSIADLETVGSKSFGFMESSDSVSFERNGSEVTVCCSYAEGVARVDYEELAMAVSQFVDGRLEWLAQEYPAALRNPEMPDVFRRLGRPYPVV